MAVAKNPAFRSIKFSNSPVAFAVLGPRGRHRRALVASTQDSMALAGLERKFAHRNRQSIFARFVSLDYSSHLVTANTGMHPVDDSRRAALTFAWRGIARSSDVWEIKELFEDISTDLEVALIEEDVEDIEAILSPVILLCERSTYRSKYRIITNRILLLTVSIIYAFMAYLLVKTLLPF